MTLEENSSGTNLLITTPVNADITDISITSSDTSVATVAFDSTYTRRANITTLVAGTTTITATLGELTASFTLTVEAPAPAVTDIDFPLDMPSTIALYGTPAGEYEGEFIVTPSNGDLTGLTITSSEPTMLEADLRPANKKQFIISTTPSAVASTQVTITISIGEITKTATVTIVSE